MHTDILSCNIEEAQQKYRFRTVSKSVLLGEGGRGGVRGQTLPSTSAVVQNSQFSNKGQVQIVN